MAPTGPAAGDSDAVVAAVVEIVAEMTGYPTELLDLDLDLEADLGVGLLVAFPASRCPLAETARLLQWLAGESTGQCEVGSQSVGIRTAGTAER